MGDDKSELDELSREIRKVIEGNKKFLSRLMDDEFDVEEEEEEETTES